MTSESELPQEMVDHRLEDQLTISVSSQHANSPPVRDLCLPRAITEGRTHEIIKRMANMMRVLTRDITCFRSQTDKKVVSYKTQKTGAGAARAAYVTPSHLKRLESK